MERLIPTLKPETTPLSLDLGKGQEKLERVALNALVQVLAAGDLAPERLPQLIEVVKDFSKMRDSADSREEHARLFGSLGMKSF
jgi:hypothetical protein